MAIQVYFGGSMVEVTKQQLVDLAKMNVITPDTEIIVDGTHSTAGNVKDIVFGSAPEVQYAPTPVSYGQ